MHLYATQVIENSIEWCRTIEPTGGLLKHKVRVETLIIPTVSRIPF